jgi:hypothetical protein
VWIVADYPVTALSGVREALKQGKKLTDEEMRDYLETLQDRTSS